jgi:hypothetical protein
MTAFDETVTDPIGIVDSVTAVKTIAVTITDTIGGLDSVATVGTIIRSITDAVGLVDDHAPAKTVPADFTDAIGLVDSHVADDFSSLILPSIDGALPPPGIQLVNVDPNATIDFNLPSIDGASIPSGVDLYTAAEEAAIAAGAQVYAHLYSAAGSLLSTLDQQVNVEWQDVYNEPGIGTLTLSRHDTDAALVVLGTQIRCFLYGRLVYTFVAENPPETTMWDPSDESVENLAATGPGRAGRLNEGRVYSVKGVVNPLAAAHRLYSFASLDFPNGATWPLAIQTVKADQVDLYRNQPVEVTTVLSGEPDIVETIVLPAPLEWPDDDAYWIWGQPDTTVVGFNFFRRQFTLTAETNVGFAVTADNFYTLYLDGTPILGENVEHRCWAEFKRLDMVLPAGTYQLAAVVENIPWAAANPAGFLCSVFSVAADTGEPLDFLVRSDSSWTVLSYPVSWPGWTPGQILLDAIAEAQARGALTGFSYSFTALSDSAGDPWPFMEGFSVPVGSSLEEMINSMVEQGWIDYRLAPGGLVLDVFNQGHGVDTGIVLQATGVEATTNIERYAISPQAPPKTRLLVKWSGGEFQLDDATAQSAHGITESFVTVDGATLTEARRQARVVLDNVKNPRDAIQVGLSPTGPADRPYTAFLVGDLLDCPGRDETLSPERLMALTVSHDPEGNPLIDLELQTRIEYRERQNAELFKMLGLGVTGSLKIRQAVYETTGLSR